MLHSSPPAFSLNAPSPPKISPLSLHDALPICRKRPRSWPWMASVQAVTSKTKPTAAIAAPAARVRGRLPRRHDRSEEHTSELQSLRHLVCRLLLEKKKKTRTAA